MTKSEWGFVAFGAFLAFTVADFQQSFASGWWADFELLPLLCLVLALYLLRAGGRIPDYRRRRDEIKLAENVGEE